MQPSRQVVAFLTPPPALAEVWATAPMLLDVGAQGFYAVPPAEGSPLKVGDHRFSRRGEPDREREPTEAELRAEVQVENEASQALFAAAGYRPEGSWYISRPALNRIHVTD